MQNSNLIQIPLCTEHLNCASNIKIDKSECLNKCSGIIVTSYEQVKMEDRPSNIDNAIIEYLSRKVPYLRKMPKDFEGSYLMFNVFKIMAVIFD